MLTVEEEDMIYGRTKVGSARVNIEVMWLVFSIETGPGMK
jgi:hypothetical protein